MKRRLFAATMLVLAVAGLTQPGSAQQAPAKPINPVGDFEYSATMPDGQTLSGVFNIGKQNDVLSGKIASQMGEAPITKVKVEERKLTMVIVTPEGAEVTFVLAFEDDNKFAGSWETGGQSGAVSGKRKTS
ncbi:MAG: hypothetical protein ACREMA_18905 [Longimicrobiales bacterium]